MFNSTIYGFSDITVDFGATHQIVINNLEQAFVGAYTEAGVSTFWLGNSYGMIHWKNNTFDGYMTEDEPGYSWRTEIISLGFGGGMIFSTGDASKVTLDNFAGLSWSMDVNVSAVLVDAGIKVSISDPYNKAGDRLIMIGGQFSGGVATPGVSEGVSLKAKTTTFDW